MIIVLFSTVMRLGKILGKFILCSAWLSLDSGKMHNLLIHGLTLDLACVILSMIKVIIPMPIY